MQNFNGKITEIDQFVISSNNRGLNYGDAVFETIKYNGEQINFWEDHYFRLMASMRILRMEIPMSFTPEFFENEILKTLEANGLNSKPARVKLLVNRGEGGYYLPTSKQVDFLITVSELKSKYYPVHNPDYIVDLYKDFYIAPGLLSTLKTNNKAINVTASIYAQENDLNNCLLLNTNKAVVEATNANIFMVKDDVIKTPPLADGCLKGIIRSKIIEIIQKGDNYRIIEESISPFELQKADEIFITNSIIGVQPIGKYRKKEYSNKVSEKLIEDLNRLTGSN